MPSSASPFFRYSPTSWLLPRKKRNSSRLNCRLIWSRNGTSNRQIDRVGERDPKRADFAALERRRQHARAAGGVVALLQQRMHAQAEFGQLRGRPLAAEQVAAKFGLELLDRPRQRRLGDVALVGGAREIQRPRDGEEISDLMHFHDRAAPIRLACKLADEARNDTQTAIAAAYRFGSQRAFPKHGARPADFGR